MLFQYCSDNTTCHTVVGFRCPFLRYCLRTPGLVPGFTLGLALGLAFSLAFSLALGLALGLASGVAVSLAVGLVLRLALGLGDVSDFFLRHRFVSGVLTNPLGHGFMGRPVTPEYSTFIV